MHTHATVRLAMKVFTVTERRTLAPATLVQTTASAHPVNQGHLLAHAYLVLLGLYAN